MDCSDFKRHHLAFLDDTLPGDLLVPAERHVMECAACAAHDTMVRRALLLARNVQSVEPSPDFAERLAARLREVDAGEREVPMDWAPSWRELARERLSTGMGSRRTVAVAASLLAMASVGTVAAYDREPEVVRLAPVVASVPEAAEPQPAEPRMERLPASELVGPATAGASVWAAALLAGEAPIQLLNNGGMVELVSFQR